jgi:upstream activation factor subunit UAF30
MARDELMKEEIYVTLIGILKKQDERIKELVERIINLESETYKLKSEKEKTFQKESKKIDKTKDKKKREPSGFAKPCTISTELANFLGKTNIQVSRTQVTREIIAYIRNNNLFDPQNKNRILADLKLKELLKLKPNDELTYYNLQIYIKPHFC